MSRRIVIEFLGQDKSLGSTTSDVDRKTSKLGDTMKTVGKAAAIGLAAGAVVAGKALFDMTKSAMEDEAAQAKLSKTLKDNAGASDAQVASVEKWITAQGRALGVTDDELRPALERLVTATGDVGKAQKLAGLAMDVSAGTGKSLESVSTALMKAQNGQVSSLSRLGINTKNAKGETISFHEATKRMSDTFGGQAKVKAETLQGKMDRLKLIFSETGEEIGAKLIPIITKMADWFLKKGLPAIRKFGGWLKENLGPIIERVRDVVQKVFGGLDGDVKGPLKDVVSTIKSIVSIIQSLWKRFGSTIIDYARSTFKNIRAVIGGAFKIIAGIFKVFSSLLKGDWKGVWEGIKMILKGAWQVIVGVVKQAGNILRAVMKILGSALKGIMGGIWDGIKAVVRNGIDAVVDGFRGMVSRIRGLGGLFRDAGRAVIGAMVDGLKNAAGVVSGIAGNVWDAVRGMLNFAIDRINSALEFRISLPGPDVSINPPNIPHLARGTGFFRGGLAVTGEQGPELVVLPRGAKVIPNRQSMGALRGLGGEGGGDTTIILQLDSREVWRGLLRQKRLNGKELGLA